MKIKVALVDDHRLFLEGMKSLLEPSQGVTVVGAFRDADEALRFLEQHSTDVVIMDVTMPILNGVDATRMIVERFPSVRVLAVSMHSDVRFVSMMLSSGASGYLTKDCAFDELVTAIEAVARGEFYLCKTTSKLMLKDFVMQIKDVGAAQEKLTDRERRILQLYSEGKSTREVADILCVSTKTVDSHRAQLMRKLNIHSIAEMTKFAVREGLTSLES